MTQTSDRRAIQIQDRGSYKKYFTEPHLTELTTETLRIRRLMMSLSILVFLLKVVPESIDTDKVSFSGISFVNVDVLYLLVASLILQAYLLIQFIWSSIDHFNENRLRLTGLKIATYQGSSSASDPENTAGTSDPRQTTLMSWWVKQSVNDLPSLVSIINSHGQDRLRESTLSIEKAIEEIDRKLNLISSGVERFEKCYKFHQISQLFRFFIFDFGVPALMSLSAVVLLFRSIWCS